jgi:hypothetical protein
MFIRTMNNNYAQSAVQICADVHFFMLLIRTGVKCSAYIFGASSAVWGDIIQLSNASLVKADSHGLV